MSTPARPSALRAPREVVYPDSDGEPMADNTRQYEWIVRLEENLDAMLPDFVAGDHLWYPVEGHPEVRVAPDVMVCLGRPKGHRGSYQQFREDGVAPSVVFEVLSPKNTLSEMMRKAAFYFRHGVRELVVIDPEHEVGWAMVRGESGEPEEVPSLAGWTSPTLGIRFVETDDALEVYRPDGSRFLGFQEVEALAREARADADAARGRAEQEAQRAEQEAQRAERETQRAEQEAQRARSAEDRAERLAARLAALGVSASDL